MCFPLLQTFASGGIWRIGGSGVPGVISGVLSLLNGSVRARIGYGNRAGSETTTRAGVLPRLNMPSPKIIRIQTPNALVDASDPIMANEKLQMLEGESLPHVY